ncbi:MAG: DNA polymerase III subunit gamma/tau [Candidatus Dormibacteria bacterium]
MSQVRQALYQRYRPRRFSELVGQEVVATTLRHAVRDQRLSHAYLFAGIRGTGKTSAARILAHAMNCEGPEDGEPCLACPACTTVNSLDVLEIDAASNRGIDEIRELRERVQFLPSQFRTKVYIIDEAHMLTADAGNAFLKTLEEPPEHARFILATTEPQRLVDTVLSRCQRFDFRRIPKEQMAEHLRSICQQEGVATTEGAMALVAEAGAGSLRDALTLLDSLIGLAEGELDLPTVHRGLGIADPGRVGRLAGALAQGRMGAAWEELYELQQAGIDPRQLARSLGKLAGEAHWRQLGEPRRGEGEAWDPPAAPAGFWLRLMGEAAALGAQLRRADDPWMALEAALLQLGPPTKSGDATLAAQVENPAPAPPGPAAQPSSTGPAVVEDPPKRVDADRPPPATAAAVPDSLWEEILGCLGRESIPVRALAKEGRLASHLEGVVTVEFAPKFAFHGRQMQAEANRQLLERACREVLAAEVRVEVVLAEAESATPEPQDTSGASVLGRAMTVFPGSRVTRLGSRPRG